MSYISGRRAIGTLTKVIVDDISIDGNTISSSGSSTLAIIPKAGQSITFDGTITLDAGVIASATSITSTVFVGDITGDVTGNVSGTAATVTTAAQSNITSLGTLTTLTVDSIIINGANIGHTSDTNAIGISSGGVVSITATTASTNSTTGALTVAGGAGIAADLGVGDDLRMISDAAVISFGANSEVTLTHSHNVGLDLKHTATADDKPIILTLQTGETDIAASDVIGKIQWQAPDEGTGTDAILVCGAIDVVSEGNFSSSNNATKMSFRLGSSETATEKMQLSSAGVLQIDSTFTCTPTATLLIKNSSGSTLKTINGVGSN